jgi:hypothetical protein
MHCLLTADLASLLSEHGPAMVCAHSLFEPEAVSRYWAASRHRFNLWHQVLGRYRRAEEAGDSAELRDWWRDHVGLMEEVLVTEMLTRVTAAIVNTIESQSGSDEVGPVTHAVHLTHVEARNRVQKIMLYGRGNSIEDAVRLNRLRQSVERWTDALIGRMATPSTRNLQYAYDPGRAAHYCEDFGLLAPGACRSTAMWLMNASLHDTLSRRTSSRAAFPEANRAVCEAILRILRPKLFDSFGTLKSIWLQRLQHGNPEGGRTISLGESLGEIGQDANPWFESDPSHFERWYQ